MKKQFTLKNVLLACLFLVISIFFATTLNTNEVKAASEYKPLFEDYDKQIQKVGKYYFKYKNGDTLMVSKQKKGSYKVIGETYNAYSNGSKVIYIKNTYNAGKNSSRLYEYNCKTRKNKLLKKLPSKKGYQVEDYSYHISTIYDGKVYITRGSFDDWKYWTYSYRLSNKKWKREKSNFSITDRYGKYVVGTTEFRTDVSPYTIKCYRLTKSGLSKGKTLAKYGYSETYAKGKLYFAAYADNDMSKCTLYRAKADGTGRKKIKTFKSSEDYGMVLVNSITSKSCIVYIDGNNYRYTYKTGKMKPIEL